jgi:nucleotide-binding universal stress UspA family protein
MHEMSSRMSIVCGSDLSEAAERASIATAQLAVRSGTKLHLMHCVHFGSDLLEGDQKSEYLQWVTGRVRRQAQRAGRYGADNSVHVKHGSPDEALIELAAEVNAELIVIGPLGAAIAQAATRLDADAICLGRRGRSNLAQALLVSVSKDLLQRAERPVLLAHAPRE